MTEVQKTIVKVPDITCGGCANSIKNALGTVEGVRQIEVDIDSKTVSIEHKGTVLREQVVEKLDSIGFPIGKG